MTFGSDFILYIFFILAIGLTFFAQIKVSATFNKYSRVATGRGQTAAEAARMILDKNGLHHVKIERVGGNLTDHYDPRGEVLRLSESVYDSTSAAAVGVAAHEAGHAIQHAEGYTPIKIRSKLVPITNFAARSTWILILIGALLSFTGIGYFLVLAGIALFSVTTLFQLVTLPCEYNASNRAMDALESCGWYDRGELRAARKVLSAAALTYVAALLVSVLQLLRLLSRFSRRR